MNQATTTGLGWLAIFRLGLVQASIGGIVVLATSTMNRVMVVELAMPAMLPGFLVALHYVVQVLRPRLGYSSDVGGRRTPWIVAGMALLGLATSAAAVAIQWMEHAPLLGIALAVVAFLFIGVGVGMAVGVVRGRVPSQRIAAVVDHPGPDAGWRGEANQLSAPHAALPPSPATPVTISVHSALAPRCADRRIAPPVTAPPATATLAPTRIARWG
jgi:hypothetical protein